MDYDVNNYQALQAGAQFEQSQGQTDGWQPIATAPRDGSTIEIRCTYGVAPWYGLYRWTSGPEEVPTQFIDNGKITYGVSTVDREPHWQKVGDQSRGFDEGPTFTWRLYNGDPKAYVDPTGGMQNSAAYWRGAVAHKYGLPLDSFEKDVKQDHPKPEVPWYKRLFGP